LFKKNPPEIWTLVVLGTMKVLKQRVVVNKETEMKHPHPIRISFIITSLGTGGAEMMLLKLLSRIDRNRFSPEVISLAGDSVATSSLAGPFRSLGIPVRIFNFMDIVAMPFRFASLVTHLRRLRPHLVSTWMYHADLIGGIAARIAGKIPLAWNIRHSDLDRKVDKRSTLLVARMCARLSRILPEKIICCAYSAQEVHSVMGYDRGRMLVIPNGFDVEEFRPDLRSREEVRRDLGIDADTLAIGLIGRFHPQKGHATFVEAAKIFSSSFSKVRFILCGDGVSWENDGIAGLIQKKEMKDYFVLLGRRSDMPRLFSALDVATSASVCGEGFSNVVGEAMSCGVPCVVTDIGDSAWIVGKTGEVVSSGSPVQLAAAWQSMVTLGEVGRRRLGQFARDRITENFSLPKIVNQYEDLFERLASSRG
jgi:glycosyltransferase involved in cell wall biosynthesis